MTTWYITLLFCVTLSHCFPYANSHCNAGHSKSSCITEELLHMLMDREPATKSNGKQDIPAFTALIKDHLQVSGKESILKFTKVPLNTGDYNPATGKFTAPKKGLYHFSCVLLQNGSGGGRFDLMKNDDRIIAGYIVPTANDSQSHSIVVDLQKGDRVYIKTFGSYQIQSTYSYFSGYIIGQ